MQRGMWKANLKDDKDTEGDGHNGGGGGEGTIGAMPSGLSDSSSSDTPGVQSLSLSGVDEPIGPDQLNNLFDDDGDGVDDASEYSHQAATSQRQRQHHQQQQLFYSTDDTTTTLATTRSSQFAGSTTTTTTGGMLTDTNVARYPSSSSSSLPADATSTSLDVHNSPYSADSIPSSSEESEMAPTTTSSTKHSSDPSPVKFEGTHLKKWSNRYSELLKFQEEHGHCSVPNDYKPNKQLGRWVKRQRHQHFLYMEGKHTTMTKERKELLDNVNFIWDSRHTIWEHQYGELVKFKKIHGHCKVPSQYSSNESLGLWVKRQRGKYKSYRDRMNMKQPSKNDAQVNESRFQRLRDIGFVFDSSYDKNQKEEEGKPPTS